MYNDGYAAIFLLVKIRTARVRQPEKESILLTLVNLS